MNDEKRLVRTVFSMPHPLYLKLRSFITTLRLLLPQGQRLPARQWRQRHNALLTILVLHAFATFVYSQMQGFAFAPSLLECLIVLVFAMFAAYSKLSRSFRSATCALGLVIASALLVQFSGGQIEMHFHYFVVVALVALYQDSLPMGLIVAFVFFQHGIIGSIDPGAVYDRAYAFANPWLWALVHTAFIGAASLAGLAAWKSSEGILEELERTEYNTRLVLDSTAGGVLGVNTDGSLAFINQAASKMLSLSVNSAISHEKVFALHDDSCPVCQTLKDGQVRDSFESLQNNEVCFPASMTVAPLRDVSSRIEDGSTLGVVLTFDDQSERELLRKAEREVERLFELEALQRAEVLALQDTLKPRLPFVKDIELGVHYVPAQGAPVGGDFYDWILLPDGTLHLAVIDVLGKGLTATKDALAVVHTLRTLSLEGVPLEEIVEKTDALLCEQNPELIATLLIVRYDPLKQNMLFAGGSHPPALLVRKDGIVLEVEAPGLAIGYPGAKSWEVTSHPFSKGDSLILYTDGLIEGTRDITEGIQALSEASLSARGLPAAKFAKTLVLTALSQADRADDSLALVVKSL